MSVTLTVVVAISYALFALAGLLSIIRILRGPSVVDRMVGSDTFATVVICVLCADMAVRGHLDTLPLVLALAMTASIGTLAVARFVTRGRGQVANPALPQEEHRHGDDVIEHAGDDGTVAADRASGAATAHSAVAEEVQNERE